MIASVAATIRIPAPPPWLLRAVRQLLEIDNPAYVQAQRQKGPT